MLVLNGVTEEQREQAREEAKGNVPYVMKERGLDLSDYEEYAKHILIEKTCRILGKGVYRRWGR